MIFKVKNPPDYTKIKNTSEFSEEEQIMIQDNETQKYKN